MYADYAHLDGFLEFVAEGFDDFVGVVQLKRRLIVAIITSQLNPQRVHVTHAALQPAQRPIRFLRAHSRK